MIFFVEPEMIKDIPFKDSYLPFFFNLFFALFFTLAVIFGNSRRGFLVSFGISLFLFLRPFGLGNLLNFLLLAGVTILFDQYFTKKQEYDKKD